MKMDEYEELSDFLEFAEYLITSQDLDDDEYGTQQQECVNWANKNIKLADKIIAKAKKYDELIKQLEWFRNNVILIKGKRGYSDDDFVMEHGINNIDNVADMLGYEVTNNGESYDMFEYIKEN